ncbi:glycosyltransferase [Methylovirgula sp. 4M-Z18]|uniref:glycosyltransferase n=1 Tax=Methylovirgula sp. 4M-Z18 TaxID=2293567 RepID=UPI0013148858|nr:glycosyltransferase [Methylovirgula sp. 4M-Z18]
MSQDPNTLTGNGFDLATATSLSSSALQQLLSVDIVRTLGAPAPSLSPCTFLLYAGDNDAGTAANLGLAQYSYHMVMTSFRSVLRHFGMVRIVTDPSREVDEIYLECRARGETCLFLSFGPPHLMTLGLRCPTVPVVAWEFGTIPDQIWDDEPLNDWRYGLRAAGKIILLSHFAAKAVRDAMGATFPAVALPPPVFDRIGKAGPARKLNETASVAIDGFVWDSRIDPFALGAPIPSPPRPREKEGLVSQGHHTPGTHAVTPAADTSRKTLRRRIGLTLRFALSWYREAVRDLLPPPITRLIGHLGGMARHTLDWWRGVGMADRPSLRRRLQISKHYALRWYREAVADGLPPQSARKLSRVVEWLDRTTQQPAAAEASRPMAPIVPPSLHRTEDEPMAHEAFAVPDLAPASIYPNDLPELRQEEQRALVQLDGLVFTSVFSPKDGRKNWQDLLTAFCTVFSDRPDATLVLKMIGRETGYWWGALHDIVSRLPAFSCRVVVLHGYLEKADYHKLIEASHFIANTSLAEGLCLPLVEFMSAGRPAISPRHTAMADYIAPENAIIVQSSEEYCSWPHDPRNVLDSSRHRIEWPSVCAALEEAYRLLTEDQARYESMAREARKTMRAFCSDDVIAPQLAGFLGLGDDAVRAAGFAPGKEGVGEC